MAEILLSLTIIGVVAAITLPSLTGNINERTWNTQRKALFARFSQAMALMPSLNGYGQLTEATEDQSAIDTTAEAFITEGLAKVLKINNICDADHLTDCGLPSKITPMEANSTINLEEIKTLQSFNSVISLDTKAAAFETANGESILVYYNQSCQGDNTDSSKALVDFMCANFIYDLNGSKGPNTIGKDIGFMSAIYPTDPVVVAPLPINKHQGSFNHTDAQAECKKQDIDSRLPNLEEAYSLFYNKALSNISDGGYWTSSVTSSELAWVMSYYYGLRWNYDRSHEWQVRCIKR